MKRIVIAIVATLFAASCVSALAAEGPMPQHHRHHHHHHHHQHKMMPRP
ncbi:MAG TPA: hypothetical protein VIF60_25120 [Burkholderiaceae bacterium]